jgi:pimeloyl-ACP methyl ester carboxylesterase
MEITLRDIEANGWRFHCREAGGSGEPVMLLHGFPETSRMWEPLMATLAARTGPSSWKPAISSSRKRLRR